MVSTSCFNWLDTSVSQLSDKRARAFYSPQCIPGRKRACAALGKMHSLRVSSEEQNGTPLLSTLYQGSSTPGPRPGAGPWASQNWAVDTDLSPRMPAHGARSPQPQNVGDRSFKGL